MIYQFEHEEVTAEDIREVMTVLNAIRYSREEIARKVLPAWAQPYRAIDKAVILSLESLERDLVAISKTETTSCENGKTKTEREYDDFRSYNIQRDCYKYVCSCNDCGQIFCEVEDYNYGNGQRGHTPSYCPACGRKLN